jgi:hypothetical protein
MTLGFGVHFHTFGALYYHPPSLGLKDEPPKAKDTLAREVKSEEEIECPPKE